MNKIATHNSVTGEKGSFWSKFLTPFAKCQRKTLVQQYDVGCRLFDIRIKKVNGKYYGAHGDWRTQQEISRVLAGLYGKTKADIDNVYLMVTYEGRLNEEEKAEFLHFFSCLKALYPYFVWGPVFAKYEDNNLTVDWTCIQQGSKLPQNEQGFVPLDGRHWQTWLPIPWLWDKIYTGKHEFNEDTFVFVDFL